MIKEWSFVNKKKDVHADFHSFTKFQYIINSSWYVLMNGFWFL